MCRALLAEAGYPDGLNLTAIHPDTEPGRSTARSYAADLAKAGVSVRLVELAPAAYFDLLRDPARTEAGEWDLATAAWAPGWLPDNGRVFLQPMLGAAGANYGGYRSPEVDALIEQALDSAEHPATAIAAWRKAERVAMSDAAIVPLLFQRPAVPPAHSSRVCDVTVVPALGCSADLATVRLSGRRRATSWSDRR